MKEPIKFDKVSDIYDFYVNMNFDIPFFLKETEECDERILELMCGTGRVSIPLLNAGRSMTCVDYSKGMLDSFQRKVADKDYDIKLVQMDVTELHLNETFGMIFLPFHSLSEILSAEKQKQALKSISLHLKKDGAFILTLQNPKTRLKQADGSVRIIGEFTVDDTRKMIVSYMNQYDPDKKIVTGFQFYEIYDSNNRMIEKRCLEVNFRPVSDKELKKMLSETDMQICDIYGDYSYGPFDEETSNFMIYRIKKD